MEINWNTVALVAGLLFYGMLAAIALKKPLKAAWSHLKALPRITQALLAAMAVVATVQAQKQNMGNGERGNGGDGGDGGTNGVMRAGGSAGDKSNAARLSGLQPSRLRIAERPDAARSSNLRSAGAGEAEETVTAEEIAQGWWLVSVTNETGYSFAMPSNAVYVGNLQRHGARSDFGNHIVDLDAIGGEATGWAFPYGPSNATTSVFWWFLDGRLQDALCEPVFAASAGLGDVLAQQGESRLWASAGEDTRTVTWERFFAGGDTNMPVYAQIALYGNGDFTVRSNGVLSVYRRIDPNDWDGDGLDNLIDGWPAVSDGDCFGTGMDWLNANCSGVLSAVPAADGGYEIVWNTNSNENAYYWLSFTATHDGTRVTVTCDGPSNLGDMVVIANEGQVCEVPLLIGPCYRIVANRPVEDIVASDTEAVVRLYAVQPSPPRLLGAGGGVGPSCCFEVERPIDIDLDGDGNGGRVTSDPDIGIVIGSVTGNCCSVECSASNYVWNCSGDCHCHGYHQWWSVTAIWEGYTRLFDWQMQCECQAEHEADPEAWFSLSAPSVIMRGGNSHIVAGAYTPPESAEEEASMSLECTAGEGKIMILAQGDGWMEVRGAAVSDSVGDVEFRLVATIGENTYTNTASLTVACVTNLLMTCDHAGVSANPPPFDGETLCPFSITNSLAPDRHLVVPFDRVATLGADGFTVRDFAVEMELVLAPAGVSSSSLSCEWEVVEAIPQMSGALQNSGGLEAWFVNPAQGGVYRFRGRCDGSPWTEGNVVLPLSGAMVDAVVESDLPQIATIMNGLVAKYDAKTRNDPAFGLKWFYIAGCGDYRGRVDNAAWRTVWRYNQVADSSGLGAVATWYGIPVPMAKISNFVCGYGCELLGVTRENQQEAQGIGTQNDSTADWSWEAGQALATGGTVQAVCRPLARQMWPLLPQKARDLWPNPAAADNHVVVPPFTRIDYNFQFRSPEMINRGRWEGLIQ